MKEDYVGFEIAKLLKEKGFKEWCFKCYGVAVLHNGVTISFDEECELKDEGRENEIEYVEGGVLYNCGCNNSDKDAKVWAAPTLQMAMKWLREVHNCHIYVKALITTDGLEGYCPFYTKVGGVFMWQNPLGNDYATVPTFEEACEDACIYALKNLI